MPPTGELYRVTLSYNGPGGLNQNVLHFQGKDGLQTSDSLADEVEGFLIQAWQSIMLNTTTISGAVVQELTPVAMDAVMVEANETGDIVLPAGNAQLAAVATLRTGVASRRKRGRIYLGALADGWTSGQTLSAGALTALDAWRSTMTARYIGDGATSDFNLVVYSRAEGGDGPTYSLTGATPVTRIDIQPTIRVQRRRRVGVGS